ncbi:hypothetical protein BRW65_21095 [Mycobacterium paraffinicum]|uniref:Uncharacterized protein n=1 Tax=Mycobacterium paraffinicum TaxID=53378 RepID=A0A1Q4HPZ2_9MYCO|nr:hypothetical protein BRW65_21095 [Mycobacterium paraffinicum]
MAAFPGWGALRDAIAAMADSPNTTTTGQIAVCLWAIPPSAAPSTVDTTATNVEQKPISVPRCCSAAAALIHEIPAATTAAPASVARKNTVPYTQTRNHCPESSARMHAAAATALRMALPTSMPRTPYTRCTLVHTGEPTTSPMLETMTSTCKPPPWWAVRNA